MRYFLFMYGWTILWGVMAAVVLSTLLVRYAALRGIFERYWYRVAVILCAIFILHYLYLIAGDLNRIQVDIQDFAAQGFTATISDN